LRFHQNKTVKLSKRMIKFCLLKWQFGLINLLGPSRD
jgi:hypothetical protein